MPDSHNRHAQNPIQWNFVQLKQHNDQRVMETANNCPPLERTTKRGSEPGEVRKIA